MQKSFGMSITVLFLSTALLRYTVSRGPYILIFETLVMSLRNDSWFYKWYRAVTLYVMIHRKTAALTLGINICRRVVIDNLRRRTVAVEANRWWSPLVDTLRPLATMHQRGYQAQ